jgi:uncharacterized protein (AIM24 family)
VAVEPAEELDEEFLYHWSRGSALYAAREYQPAWAALSRALRLRPNDLRVLSLMALVRYKQKHFEQAAELYATLVEASPGEPSARMNLGLALMKARRFAEAARHLELLLEQRPDHTRAMGYLGLALLELGDPARAREWFAKAGNEDGLARCDRALASGAAALASSAAPEELAGEPPEGQATPAPASVAAESMLGRFATAHPTPEAEPGEVSFDGTTLCIGVDGGWHASLAGLYGARGALGMEPTMKRCRGRESDMPFGEGSQHRYRISGRGSLLFHARDRHFTALEIDGDAGYFREEMVFAFETTVEFENGRIGAWPGPELNLVYLHGRGRFVLRTLGEMAAVKVSAHEPVSVPIRAMVGWQGAITPRVVTPPSPRASAAGAEASGAALVELNGDGTAFLDPASGATRRARRDPTAGRR